jgi:subtilisin family serine protease
VAAETPADPGDRIEAPPELPEQQPADADGTVGAVVETEDGIEVVTVDAEPDELDEVEADLEDEPEVVEVVDVFVDVPARVTSSNDPRRSLQWNLDDLNVDLLPDGTDDGSGEIVAVVDTGVRYDHPDLRGRVDCAIGADFSAGTTRSGTGCKDPYGHGTHVAGIISAISDNGAGVAGLSAATIMPVRVLDANGNGMASNIIAGLYWAADHGADVINLSLGSDFTHAYDVAIRYALDKDIVVVVASGNNRGEGNLPQSPATYPGVFSVAATDELGLSAPFSYSGPTNLISAPGDLVLSTIPTGYEYASGTSMAAPHVSAIVARYRAIHPTATIDDIRTAIQTTAIDLQESGFDNDTGYGLIDALELLGGGDAPADPTRGTAAAAPRITSVRGGDGTLQVHWAAPAWTGDRPITSFYLSFFRLVDGEYRLVSQRNVWDETLRSTTFGGFVNGSTYVVLVSAKNPASGQWSLPSNPTRPYTTPAAPGIGTATAGPSAARVRWTSGSNGGSAITSWVVRTYRGWDLVKETKVGSGSARDARIGSLTDGRGYRFRVRAVNKAGAGPWSGFSNTVRPY